MSDDIKTLATSMDKDIISQLEAENKMLRFKLSKYQNNIRVSDEEQICIDQINILRSKSDERELNLDEVKRLDLLIKNLKIIRENSIMEASSSVITDIEEEDLVKLARG